MGQLAEGLKLISCPLKTRVSFNHQLSPVLPKGSAGLPAPTASQSSWTRTKISCTHEHKVIMCDYMSPLAAFSPPRFYSLSNTRLVNHAPCLKQP